jgi:effector-binding domain-containing protein
LDDDISVDEIRGMFALKKAQVEQTVREELTRLQHIEARLQMIDADEFPTDFEIVVKSVPEQPYLALREVMPSFEAARLIFADMLRILPASAHHKALGNFTAVMHSETFEDSQIDIELGVVTSEPIGIPVTLPGERRMTTRFLPAVESMVTSVHLGLPQLAHQCRAVVATWVEANGYIFAGTGREVFIVPPRPGKEPETVLEVQYPIARPDNLSLPPP